MRLLALIMLLGLGSAQATTFTDRSAFDAAFPILTFTQDFDSLSAGDSPDTAELTFNFTDPFGSALEVRDDFATTSGSNYLGTDDAFLFNLIAGDLGFDFTFSSTQYAVGLYIITADLLSDNDFSLTADDTTASLLAASSFSVGGNNGYFLGLFDPDGFTDVLLSSAVGSPTALYSVDDIVTAIPEPSFYLSTLALFIVLSMLIYYRRKTVNMLN